MLRMKEALTLIKDVDINLKFEKCSFLEEKIDNLGHDIRPSRL